MSPLRKKESGYPKECIMFAEKTDSESSCSFFGKRKAVTRKNALCLQKIRLETPRRGVEEQNIMKAFLRFFLSPSGGSGQNDKKGWVRMTRKAGQNDKTIWLSPSGNKFFKAKNDFRRKKVSDNECRAYNLLLRIFFFLTKRFGWGIIFRKRGKKGIGMPK